MGLLQYLTVCHIIGNLSLISYNLLGSKRQHEIHDKKRSKIERPRVVDNKDRHQDGSRRANNFHPREATSSTQATQKENTSSRASGYATGRHKFAEFDRYQVPVYPLYDSYPKSTYQYHVNFQSRNEPREFFYHNRGQIPNMTGFPPSRPHVGEFTSRLQHVVFNDSRHARTNLYDCEMKNYGWR